MTEHLPWIGRRFTKATKAAVHRTTAALRHTVGSRAGSPSLLVVARDPAGPKVARVLDRVNFYCPPGALPSDVRVVKSAGLRDIAAARLVLEVDQGMIAPTVHRLFDHVFNVDYERNAMDGWQLCKVAEHVAGLPTPARRAEARWRFRAAVEQVRSKSKEKVYVFGTGPSLAKAIERVFSDGYIVVCNTIVRDPELWHHLKPDFITAGDAIYHFGHSSFARAFRDDLRLRLEESRGRTWFVYPEMFDAIVQRELRGLEESLVPVPYGAHGDITVDLSRRFELPPSSNVLNILLLPLACTLSRSVWLWGFDGRAPTDKLFWSNSTRHSYPELMPALLEEHPAFFAKFVPANRESEYVRSVHGDELDQRLRAAEAKGFAFHMMHFSWTDTLNRRGGEASAHAG